MNVCDALFNVYCSIQNIQLVSAKLIYVLLTQGRILVGQPVEHWVQGANEEVMAELHDREPQQMPQEEPRKEAGPKTGL